MYHLELLYIMKNQMNQYFKIIFFIVTVLMSAYSFSKNTGPDFKLFEKKFHNWTRAFNHKNLAATCNFFSKEVVANYQGYPEKNYASICSGFKKIFAESDHQYQYDFKLHDVYRSHDLAAVRVTWFLRVTHNNQVSQTQDEGLDVFKRDIKGSWKIVNYLSYMSKEASDSNRSTPYNEGGWGVGRAKER